MNIAVRIAIRQGGIGPNVPGKSEIDKVCWYHAHSEIETQARNLVEWRRTRTRSVWVNGCLHHTSGCNMHGSAYHDIREQHRCSSACSDQTVATKVPGSYSRVCSCANDLAQQRNRSSHGERGEPVDANLRLICCIEYDVAAADRLSRRHADRQYSFGRGCDDGYIPRSDVS
jgi:hypothetical protein